MFLKMMFTGLLSLFLVAETCNASEEVAYTKRQRERRCPRDEDPCAPCEKPCDKKDPASMQNRDVNPSARGCPGNMGVITMADFLWWTAHEDEIAYAGVNENPAQANFGNIERVSPEWKPGFRVGLGWNTTYDGWDLLALYTWYYNTSRSQVTSDTNATQLGIVTSLLPTTPGNIGLARGTAKLRYQMGDLLLGRAFFVSKGLSLRPYTGIEGGWISRKYNAFYDNQNAGVTQVVPATYDASAKYWGLSPKFGLDSEWHVGMDIRLFADFAFAMLYGRSYDVNQTTVEAGVTTSDVRVNNSWRAVPHGKLFLGAGWASCIDCYSMFFSAKIGWEINHFWGLHTFPFGVLTSQTALESDADLAMQGLTVNLRLDF